MTVVIPFCFICKHFLGTNDSDEYYCEAFEEGIPAQFLTGGKIHDTPVEGDHGIQFESKNKSAEQIDKDALADCVGRKMKVLSEEGYERDQALAIAYSMCGEAKKQSAKKAFTDPFPEGVPNVLEGNGLVRALQLDISAEQDAAALYTAHADKASDERVKDTLNSIAREELVHVGELEALIDYLTGAAYSEAVGEGVAEASGVTKSFVTRIQKVDEKLRLVSGVVLEPDSIDLQGDKIDAEDIRKAMEGYMINSRMVYHQHQNPAKAAVVECFIAPVDFRLADKELIRKGSWVMTVKVFDDSIWKAVMDGKVKGYSIGGRGVRTPVK